MIDGHVHRNVLSRDQDSCLKKSAIHTSVKQNKAPHSLYFLSTHKRRLQRRQRTKADNQHSSSKATSTRKKRPHAKSGKTTVPPLYNHYGSFSLSYYGIDDNDVSASSSFDDSSIEVSSTTTITAAAQAKSSKKAVKETFVTTTPSATTSALADAKDSG
jgi:hypothetical protein